MRPRNFKLKNYYHVFARGIERKMIFKEDSDYSRFIDSIFQFNADTNQRLFMPSKKKHEITEIFCFTLMKNHFHFILKETHTGGISKFMQKILSGYALYFNKKYNRKGRLMETTFKDKCSSDYLYLKHLVNYIHNNPIKYINPDYKSEDVFNGYMVLTQKEKDFAKNYEYKYFSEEAKKLLD